METAPEVMEEVVEEVSTEEVTDFADPSFYSELAQQIMPATTFTSYEEPKVEATTSTEKKLSDLSQDELFEKLQNYKKLLDNGLIMQGEYDALKKEILSYM
jgi:hypothetical protein